MNAQVSSSAGNWVAVAMVMAVHCEGVDVSCQLSLWLLWLEVTNLVNTFAGWPPIILSHVPWPSLHPHTSLQSLNNSALIISGHDVSLLGILISSMPVAPMEAKLPQGKIRFRTALSISNDAFADKPSVINSLVLSVHSLLHESAMAYWKLDSAVGLCVCGAAKTLSFSRERAKHCMGHPRRIWKMEKLKEKEGNLKSTTGAGSQARCWVATRNSSRFCVARGSVFAEAETACAEESEVGCTTKHPDSKSQAASLARACLSGDERSLQTTPDGSNC